MTTELTKALADQTERFAKLEAILERCEAKLARCADLEEALGNLIDAVDAKDNAAIKRAVFAARGLTVLEQ